LLRICKHSNLSVTSKQWWKRRTFSSTACSHSSSKNPHRPLRQLRGRHRLLLVVMVMVLLLLPLLLIQRLLPLLVHLLTRPAGTVWLRLWVLSLNLLRQWLVRLLPLLLYLLLLLHLMMLLLVLLEMLLHLMVLLVLLEMLLHLLVLVLLLLLLRLWRLLEMWMVRASAGDAASTTTPSALVYIGSRSTC
jgi:hypothetical protein